MFAVILQTKWQMDQQERKNIHFYFVVTVPSGWSSCGIQGWTCHSILWHVQKKQKTYFTCRSIFPSRLFKCEFFLKMSAHSINWYYKRHWWVHFIIQTSYSHWVSINGCKVKEILDSFSVDICPYAIKLIRILACIFRICCYDGVTIDRDISSDDRVKCD